ncbi:hypothetical protein COK37_19085 [Bacillus thuringiensis]|uniref:DUF3902 family protein n=1 Tax=Bacillus thuringiensis TaxID=1428 RepID=UPI000BF5FA67|nr:DUF3902 family protein [Bacillus thuringiensis]PEV45123.1 hypothetical protein CN432_20500 [Bacillus thuringiensis]PFR66276.1 hypothetical protein COK37_19085 [Bacillus thuringiensis]PFT74632.1 hypothetical protein COK70_27995 [Bacillus thuringiensis]PFV84827.1 hypothetical protein COL06_22815 [Bacillus thuringiensis]
MKSLLKNIIISLIFAIGGIIVLLVNIAGNQDWVLNWIGVLMAYLSLAILIDLDNKIVYYETFPKILKRILFISFNTSVLGIILGISYQILGGWNLNTMMFYWVFILLLYLITILTLITLMCVKRNGQNDGWLYKFIIFFNIFLTLVPVLYPVVLTIIGNGMNSSAGN